MPLLDIIVRGVEGAAMMWPYAYGMGWGGSVAGWLVMLAFWALVVVGCVILVGIATTQCASSTRKSDSSTSLGARRGSESPTEDGPRSLELHRRSRGAFPVTHTELKLITPRDPWGLVAHRTTDRDRDRERRRDSIPSTLGECEEPRLSDLVHRRTARSSAPERSLADRP
jgi:hypothetical protein